MYNLSVFDTQVCRKCKKEKPLSDFYKDKRYKLGHIKACKACGSNQRDPEYHRKWYLKNKEKVQARMRANRKKVRAEVYNHYGRKCACCGEDEIMFLTVDHVNNDGYKHRQNSSISNIYFDIRKEGFPDTYQILCMNCNLGKHRNKGVCPHKVVE